MLVSVETLIKIHTLLRLIEKHNPGTDQQMCASVNPNNPLYYYLLLLRPGVGSFLSDPGWIANGRVFRLLRIKASYGF